MPSQCPLSQWGGGQSHTHQHPEALFSLWCHSAPCSQSACGKDFSTRGPCCPVFVSPLLAFIQSTRYHLNYLTFRCVNSSCEAPHPVKPVSFIVIVALFSPQTTAEPEREARPTCGRFESILWIWDSNPARQTEAHRSASGYTEDQQGAHKEVCIISTYIHVYIYTQCKSPIGPVFSQHCASCLNLCLSPGVSS